MKVIEILQCRKGFWIFRCYDSSERARLLFPRFKPATGGHQGNTRERSVVFNVTHDPKPGRNKTMDITSRALSMSLDKQRPIVGFWITNPACNRMRSGNT
jgi:hypothetical protein